MTMNSFSQGGADRVGVLLANGFANAGIPTRLALMRDCGEAEAELRSLLHSDVFVVSAGKPMGISLSRRLQSVGHQHLERVRGLRVISREIRRSRPAVVFAASDDMALTTALARGMSKAGPPFAMKLTSTLFRPGARTLGNVRRFFLFDFVFRRYEAVITLSEAERRQLAKLYPSQASSFWTLPNPYVTPEMRRPAEKQVGCRAPAIVTAGRFVKSKRLDVMLRAFARVKEKSATLTLLGDGPLRQDLIQLACSLEISDRVTMPGYVRDVIPWLQQSDLFLLTSDYEGLPAVLLEALACNVPVVTTDSFLSAQQLLVGATSCAIVAKGDAQAIASAVDNRLKGSSSGDKLREIAMPYRVESSVSAHIQLLADLVHQTAQKTSAR